MNWAQGTADGEEATAGIYVGVSQLEYARLSLESGAPLNAYYATGAHLSAASGRISFTFGLKGPALTVGECLTWPMAHVDWCQGSV